MMVCGFMGQFSLDMNWDLNYILEKRSTNMNKYGHGQISNFWTFESFKIPIFNKYLKNKKNTATQWHITNAA